MKKRLFSLFLMSFTLFSCLFIPKIVAAKSYDFSTMSPTVKIISYRHTKNNDLEAYSSGSATIIRKDGLILTNNHVVEERDDKILGAFQICITFENEEKPVCEYTASFIARNKDLDLALLQIDSQDIRNKTLPSLKYLPYEHDKVLKEEDTLFVYGYPDIGGETITTTKGQVSGFEEFDQIRYIKTDTDISSGNSGGTARDEEGNFVGVPTYVMSSIENLGYILDIHEGKDWINENKNLKPEFDNDIYELFVTKIIIKNDAKENKTYNHPYYPAFTLKIPDDWEFSSLERDYIYIFADKKTKNYSMNFSIKEFPFELTEEYLNEAMFKKFEKNKEYYQNYERTKVNFKGIPAFLISYNNSWGDTHSLNYIIPYGNVGIIISYDYDLKEAEEDKEIYESILENFKFIDSPKIVKAPKSLTRENPSFSISTTTGWYLLENQVSYYDDYIVEFLRPDNIEGNISLSHYELSESDKHMSSEEYLKELVRSNEYISSFRLVNKNDSILVDGLPGVSITYNYQGDEIGQTRKTSEIYIFDTDHYYKISYDDLDTNYDTHLEDFKKILSSFKNLNEESNTENGTFELGSLNYVFYDISYHRFEQSIASLKDKGIIEGFEDGTFKPEKSVGRIEALKMIILSKSVLDEKQGNSELSEELENYTSNEFKELDFSDTKFLTPFKEFIRYARDNEIIEGIGENTFKPYSDITLAQACKILFNVYEIPVWEITEKKGIIPWYKPYMDKAYELGMIPNGVYYADHELTRGELAQLIENLMSRAESRGYYY